MAKKIMKILCFLTLFAILMSAMPVSVFALSDSITSVSDNSVHSANEKVSTLQSDQEVKFNGTATEYFSSTGTCSWNVQVEKIVSGPSELQGHTVTVALWSGDSGEFPSGSMDPEIGPGDKVGVYGLYVGEDYVTLSGSGDYYITKTSASNQPSVTVRYPNGAESISIGTQVQVSAHATDDTAVTGLTFYYSSDGGSNWDLIGEGARISGTAIDGVWNRTWNTDGLSAGTNYMIKAVANDGAFTSEDRSDSTFSLVGAITPVEEWSKTFGGTGDDFATAVQQTSDGGYILAGVKSLKSDGDDVSGEAWLVKTDSNGNKQWDKTFGCTEGYRIALSVQQTLDGGYIFAGSNDAFEGWLVKTDSYGNTQWEKTFSTVTVMAAQQTSDGSYILAGVRTDSSDGWLMKIDPYGNTQWDKTFGGPGDDALTAIQQTSDGGYILAGATESYGGDWDGWLVKTDQNGNQQWDKTFGGIDCGILITVRQTSDGGYILASGTASANCWLVKTDSNGNKQREMTFGDAGGEMVGAVQTRDGGYILAGTTKSYGAGSRDGWLVKTDSNGNELWEKTFGGPGDDGLMAIQQTSDGGYILAGGTDSYGAGASDFWLIKVKEEEAEITGGNIIFQDNFDSYSVGAFPSSGGWNLKYNGYGNTYQNVDNSQSVSSPNSLKLEGKKNWAACADHALSETPDQVVFEADVKVTRPDGGTDGWANAFVDLVDPDEGWGTRYGSVLFGADQLINGKISYNFDQWYHVKAKVDMLTRKNDVWIDDVFLGTFDITSEGYYKSIRLDAENSGHTRAWFDNVKVLSW